MPEWEPLIPLPPDEDPEFIPVRRHERMLPLPRHTATITQADVELVESAGDALIRSRHIQTATRLYALALRLRAETGLHPLRRESDV